MRNHICLILLFLSIQNKNIEANYSNYMHGRLCAYGLQRATTWNIRYTCCRWR